MTSRDQKYLFLRETLDRLGYNEPLSLESCVLVERLVSDLCLWKDRFIEHKDIAQVSLRRCRELETTIQPLKEEHERILSQNNCLHHEIQHTREQYEKSLKDLKNHVADLESAYSDLEFANMEQMSKIGALEEQIFIQNEKLLQYEGLPKNVIKHSTAVLALRNSLTSDQTKKQDRKEPTSLPSITSVNNYISEVMSQKTPRELTKEVERLKSERAKLSNSIELYQMQIKHRDEEIARLIEQPQAHISSKTSGLSCRCHSLEIDDEYLELADCNITAKFNDLNMKLQSTVNSALFLAEKVKFLEKRLKEKRETTEETASKEQDYVCVCREIAKLQEVLHTCECSKSCESPPAESKLKLKVSELLNMLDSLSSQNKDLRKQLEEMCIKGVADSTVLKQLMDKNNSVESCREELRQQLTILHKENADLRVKNSSLQNIIEGFEASKKNAISQHFTNIRKETNKSSSSASEQLQPKSGENFKSSDNMCKGPSNNADIEEKEAFTDFSTMKTSLLKEVEKLCKKIVPTTELLLPDIESKLKVLTNELERVRAERDYYCKEYHYLQEKLRVTPQNKASDGERNYGYIRADKHHLQDEMMSLQQQVIELQHSLHYERCQHKIDKLKLEDTIKYLEMEKNKFLSQQDEFLNKMQFLKDTADSLNKKIQESVTENSCLQSQYSNLRTINEHLERSLKNAEVSYQKIEHELNNALKRIQIFEYNKNELLADVAYFKKEAEGVNEKLMIVIKEKDNLMEKLDTQAVELSKLERENRQKLCLINMLEQKMSRLNCQVLRCNNDENRATKEITNLKKELELCAQDKLKLTAENRALQSDIELLVKDCEIRNHQNESYKKEIVKLKKQLQNYVQEVRRVEQMLEAKEIERAEMLEQFKTLSTEAMNLESNNQTLESEKNSTNNNLRIAQEKLQGLQATIQTKDSLVTEMEEQIMELSKEVSFLKNELVSMGMEKSRLQQEVETSKQLINSMDIKEKINESEIHSLEEQIEQVTTGINQSHALKDMLASQIEEQQNLISTLESAVANSRKEAIEQSLRNSSMQQKVEDLQNSVDKLHEKLSNVNNALIKCQENCEEYRNENMKLKRELVNERFEKVRAEETQSYSTSL